MNDSEFVENFTGVKPSVCSCSQCVNQCKAAPCLGTPSDIIRLIEAGYGKRLAVTTWAVGLPYGLPEVQMIQPIYDDDRRCCTFLTDAGLCELHDKGLKPTEGRLSHHSTTIHDLKTRPPVNFVIAGLWRAQKNMFK